PEVTTAPASSVVFAQPPIKPARTTTAAIPAMLCRRDERKALDPERLLITRPRGHWSFSRLSLEHCSLAVAPEQSSHTPSVSILVGQHSPCGRSSAAPPWAALGPAEGAAGRGVAHHPWDQVSVASHAP